ncbi:MAG: hypothetical protein GY882_11665 [Actinomycetia bacterium]|nr:hypothetical protein [Actinomycetes bacterium]MCP4845756.1 hypothetical protein [Actinomycetes bacterium]
MKQFNKGDRVRTSAGTGRITWVSNARDVRGATQPTYAVKLDDQRLEFSFSADEVSRA